MVADPDSVSEPKAASHGWDCWFKNRPSALCLMRLFCIKTVISIRAMMS